MRSSAFSEPLDLERGHPVSSEDVAALRRLRARPASGLDEYLSWLSSLPPPTLEALKARPGPRGEPFVLSR
jgi:hypothetical protein